MSSAAAPTVVDHSSAESTIPTGSSSGGNGVVPSSAPAATSDADSTGAPTPAAPAGVAPVGPADAALVTAQVKRADTAAAMRELVRIDRSGDGLASPTASAAHGARHAGATTTPATPSDSGLPLNVPQAPFQDVPGLAGSTGTMSASSGGAGPGGIAWLGAAALGIVLLVQRRRLASNSRIPAGPALVLDCSPD